MQKLLLYILVFTTFLLRPLNQESQISKVSFGETLDFGDISIVFGKVISDSRCPKTVTCVWAGEAKVLVSILKNGKPVKHKELIFHATGVVDTDANIIYKSEDIQISGIGLFPYPETPNKISNKAYCLELKFN